MENTGLDFYEILVTFSSTSPHITLFYVCFCLKMPYLIYVVGSLNSQPIALYFWIKALYDWIKLTLDSASVFKQGNHQEKFKNMALSTSHKDTYLKHER